MDMTVQSIFRLGYAAFESSHRLPEYVRHAAHCVMVCRTAALGGHRQGCPEGHFARVWYNSCKHRFCPQCAYLQVERWLVKQKARVLGCAHYHVIFTIPSELHRLWRQNQRLLTNLLVGSVRETLFELLGDARYLGARVGVMASLPTWSKTLQLHPHVHCLVTGGGLTASGEWVGVKRSYLFPFRVARDLFRGKLRAALLTAWSKGGLVLPEGMGEPQVLHLLNKLGRKKWNVKVCEQYGHGEGVLVYLARYLKGGPFSNRRIVGIADGQVTFHYGRARKAFMSLSLEELLGRLLQHVPPPRSVWVRCWGLYASSQKAALAQCRELVGQGPVEVPGALSWQDVFEEGEEHPERCPVCGKRLVCLETFPPMPGFSRSRGSPLVARARAHAA